MEEATNLIRVTAVGLALAAGAAFPAAAGAHPTQLSTSPAVGDGVREAPAEVGRLMQVDLAGELTV